MRPFDLSIRPRARRECAEQQKEGQDMDRFFAGGTVNAARRARGRRCSCCTRCCRIARASMRLLPSLPKSFRVIVPELPGFGRSQAAGGKLADIADRMAEAVHNDEAGNGRDRARQWLWRLCRAADGDPSSRYRVHASSLPIAVRRSRKQAARLSATWPPPPRKRTRRHHRFAMRRLFAPEFQAAEPGPDGRPPRGVSQDR